ncbi:MAG TPA: aminotransferase class IV [Pyrinomonadaceae bacterium]|nr:aminotransferase class IV [Pyrinomonadaceae bacterium]
MHKYVSFCGQILSPAEPSIAALSSSSLYGRGIFTTLSIYNEGVFLWDKHWRRLAGNAAKLGIDLDGFSGQDTRRALEDLIKANKVVNGRARITFLDESSSNIWPFKTTLRTSLLITTADSRPMPENFSLTVSPYFINSASPLAGVKSCNYLEKMLALDEARERGYDEAIQLNERGDIASGCMSNIFWLAAGTLLTPSLRTGCIAGTTREFVLENLECTEAETDIESLRKADTIFMTSAGIGIQRVDVFDGRRFERSIHPILSLVPEK